MRYVHAVLTLATASGSGTHSTLWPGGEGFAAGTDDAFLLWLEVFAAFMGAAGRGRRQAAFALDGPADAGAEFDHEVYFGSGGGAVEAGGGVRRGGGEELLDNPAFPARAGDGRGEQVVDEAIRRGGGSDCMDIMKITGSSFPRSFGKRRATGGTSREPFGKRRMTGGTSREPS